MTRLAYTLRPSVRAALLAFLVHHNPFYLISALCMLGGCYALNSGLAARAGDLPKVLALIGVLNAYEAILIGLGLYLIRRRGILRDGRTLLLLEAPFLVDLAFLNAEVGSASIGGGCLLNVLVLTLAVLKAGIVLYTLWDRMPRRLLAMVGLNLAVLFLMPCAFTRAGHHQNGNVTPAQFYAAWWVVGGLMIIYELQARCFDGQTVADMGLRRFVRGLYLCLPIASIILHLSLLHWVYRVTFVAGDLSPLLIGGAFVLGRASRLPQGESRALRVLMPIAAVVLAAEHSPAWSMSFGPRLTLTPTMLVAGAAYVTIVYCVFLHRAIRLLIGAMAAGLIYLYGPSFAQVVAAAAWAWERLVGIAQWLGARTAMEWGFAAVASAFAFLGIGAGVSLRKDPAPQPAAAE